MKHKRGSPFRRILASVLCLVAISLIGATAALAQDETQHKFPSQKEVAELVRDQVLDGDFGERTLWMTERPLDQSHVARDLIAGRNPDLTFPYAATWLVMIDDHPAANFAHPVRWLFVDADTGDISQPVDRDFPPTVLSAGGDGSRVSFRCAAVTSVACEDLSEIPSAVLTPTTASDCLHAVLVSGGIDAGANKIRYRQNLRSMYQILRGAGYPAANIFVYYADGGSLDLDDADGDGNDATGSDVTGDADEGAIRAKIQNLCGSLDSNTDILLTYFSNHGADDTGVCLWDGNNNGTLEAAELYSPAELAADTANCQVCRQFMIHDQCFAGDFLPMASDGNHANLAVYAAASAVEYSWGREYMAQWEQNDPSAMTVNAMHQDVVANGNLTSTPGVAEGAPGVGGNSLADCCLAVYIVPWWVYLLVAVIIIIPIWWFLRRRSAAP